MKIPKFERNKFSRLLRTYGSDFIFQRDILTELKEPSGEKQAVSVHGLFHQTTSPVSVVAQESASLQTKQTSYILAMYEDGSKVKQDDTVMVGEKTYKVTGVNDINNWGIAVNISVEVVLNGK